MKPAGLIFLRDSPAAQRLAIAWPLVTDRTLAERELIRAWACLADVPPHVAARLAPVLWQHAICRDDGTTDPLAEQYVARQVEISLRRSRRQ